MCALPHHSLELQAPVHLHLLSHLRHQSSVPHTFRVFRRRLFDHLLLDEAADLLPQLLYVGPLKPVLCVRRGEEMKVYR